MKLLHLTASDLTVHDGLQRLQNRLLKFVFPTRKINFRTQHLTCSHIYHRVTIHYYIFLKPIPAKFLYCIIHHLLIVHFFMDDLLIPKFILARHTDRTTCTKNNLLVFCDGVFDAFQALLLFSYSFDGLYGYV